MIDKKLEPYYDNFLSLFLGVIVILILHSFYDQPRTVMVTSEAPYEGKNKCSGINVSDK